MFSSLLLIVFSLNFSWSFSNFAFDFPQSVFNSANSEILQLKEYVLLFFNFLMILRTSIYFRSGNFWLWGQQSTVSFLTLRRKFLGFSISVKGTVQCLVIESEFCCFAIWSSQVQNNGTEIRYEPKSFGSKHVCDQKNSNYFFIRLRSRISVSLTVKNGLFRNVFSTMLSLPHRIFVNTAVQKS